MSLRHAFVTLPSHPDADVRALCRQYRISPTTGYALLARFQAEGVAGLACAPWSATRNQGERDGGRG